MGSRRQSASLPRRPEPKLDTMPVVNIEAMIEQRVGEALAAERETMIEIVAEALAESLHEEQKAARLELADEVRRLRIELSSVEAAIGELREVVANEAKRDRVFDLPASYRYPCDLN